MIGKRPASPDKQGVYAGWEHSQRHCTVPTKKCQKTKTILCC